MNSFFLFFFENEKTSYRRIRFGFQLVPNGRSEWGYLGSTKSLLELIDELLLDFDEERRRLADAVAGRQAPHEARLQHQLGLGQTCRNQMKHHIFNSYQFEFIEMLLLNTSVVIREVVKCCS